MTRRVHYLPPACSITSPFAAISSKKLHTISTPGIGAELGGVQSSATNSLCIGALAGYRLSEVAAYFGRDAATVASWLRGWGQKQ